MTTNVFDAKVGVLATDSRWSQRFGRWLIYIDDTNFEKIEIFAKKTAFMFAGNGRQIQNWKNWIRSNPSNKIGMPSLEGICLHSVDIGTKVVTHYQDKNVIRRDNALFAGSGAEYASVCWSENKDAKRAVETAKSVDPATGGKVKFVNTLTGEHNLDQESIFSPKTIEEVDKELSSKGIIMAINSTVSQIHFPKKSTSASVAEPEHSLLREKIASGELSAEAPGMEGYGEWTVEEKNKLVAHLGVIFGWEDE